MDPLPIGEAHLCEETGGAEVREESQSSGSGVSICNGEEGPAGPTGPTGPTGTVDVDGNLPPNKTMTGVWVANGAAGETVLVPISFPIKLAHSIEETKAHFGKATDPEPFETTCPGTSQNPGGETGPVAGNLCVFLTTITTTGEVTFDGIEKLDGAGLGANKRGALLKLTFTTAGSVFGGWAVKSES